MRKNLTIFCVFALSLLWVGAAFAEYNANAYFMIDTNLATQGYQETQPKVTNIGATTQVGFAMYSQAWDNAKGFTVRFEWDSAKATFRSSSSEKITDDDFTINGVSFTPSAEANILGAPLITAGESNIPGMYTNSYVQQGDVPAATTAVGLIYFAVFRTTAGFKTTDQLSIKASVTVSAQDAKEKFLGYRYFNVNQVAVEDAKWGDVKAKFKNF